MARRFKCRLKLLNGRFSSHEGVGPGIQSARDNLVQAMKRASGGRRADLTCLKLAFWVQDSPGRPWYRLPTPAPAGRGR